MVTISKRLLSVLLIMVMAITLVPPLGKTTEAATSSAGLSLLPPFSTDTTVNPSGISLTKDNPYITSQSSISISGRSVGVVRADTVSYRIISEGSNPRQERDERPSPYVNDLDDQEFTFQEVRLYPGLNRIEIYAQVSGSTRTVAERFVYFENSADFSNLHILDVDRIPVVNFTPPVYNPSTFESNKRMFETVMRVTNPRIMIEGDRINADEVSLEGQVGYRYGNQFVVDASSAGLVKGDYDVWFTARNSSGSSTSREYKLAISNGEPMVLDIKANLNSEDVSLNQLRSVTLDDQFKDNSNNLTFSGYLYVDQDQPLSSLKVSLQDPSTPNLELASTVVEAVYLNQDYDHVIGVNNNYTVYYLQDVEIAGYDLYHNPGQYILNFETYEANNPTVKHTHSQTYQINMVNNNQPYIKDVTQNGVSLSVDGQITRINQDLVVEVGGTATSVTLRSDRVAGSYNPDPTHTRTVTDGKATFSLQNLESGVQTFVITASDGAVNSSESYLVEVILTPTVRMWGMNNGDIFNTTADIPLIIGEYVNFPNTTHRGSTIVTFNGEEEPQPYNGANDHFVIRNADGSVCSSNCLLDTRFGVEIKPGAIREGLNELKFTLTTNRGDTYSRSLVFYYLSDDAPFIDLNPYPMSSYTEGEFSNVYHTTEEFAELRGTIANGAYLRIRNNSDFEDPVLATCQFVSGQWSAVGQVGCPLTIVDFTSRNSQDTEIRLTNLNLIMKNTDGTYNFNATNNFTIELFKNVADVAPSSILSITIVRSPAAYDPIELTKGFLEKGVINRNYLPFTIDTDGAVAVTVNKLPMERIPQPVADSNRIRYHLDVPLKSGSNKLNIEVEYPGITVKATEEILSSSVNQPGAAQKDTLGRKVRFRMFNNDLELTFPRGTLVRQSFYNDNYNPINDQFAKLFNDTPLFFGIALPSTGLVLEENKDHMNNLRGRFNVADEYVLASEIYWIDAGLIEEDGSVKGGTAPYSESGDLRVHQRYFERMRNTALEPSQEGTLTLKYDPNIRVGVRQNLTVMYHGGGFTWENLGGKVDSKKGTITVPFRKFGYYTVMRFDKNFNDVVQHDWARDDIEILRSRGWMMELNPDTFGSNIPASRGELAQMLVKALDIPLDYHGAATFADVPVGSGERNRWHYDYIETAARVGIVRGMEHNLFRPSDPISRQEAAVMIARAMNLRLSSYESARPKLEKKFTDAANINTYAFPSIEAVEKKGIMEGLPGVGPKELRFDPLATLTRAQLATITVRMLRDLKHLEK